MWAILLLIAGVVLRYNPTWFAGAGTVGLICIVIALAILVMWLVLLIAAFLGA